MPNITTCTKCGKLYEASSEEEANRPERSCSLLCAKPVRPKPERLCFVDLETTGLDETVHHIIEIALIRTALDGAFTSRFSCLILPPPLAETTVDPIAREVNSYDREKWIARGARPLARVWGEIQAHLAGAIPAGQNTDFDLRFLTAAAKRFDDELSCDYHRIDVAQLAMPWYVRGQLERVKLEHLCKFFDVENEKAHSAMSDCEAARCVYIEIMRRMVTHDSAIERELSSRS